MGRPIDTTPLPSFLRGQQNLKWTVAGAISELVDNSLGAGRGNANEVWIIHDTTNRTLAVADNGRGMDAVGRLFQLGNTIGRTPGDIGLYGQGGTLAIIWLPHTVTVRTLKGGATSVYAMRWEEQFHASSFFMVPDDWSPATAANTPEFLLERKHGTIVTAQLLKGRGFHPSNVIRDLSKTYAPAIRNGKKISWFTVTGGKTREARELADPFKLSDLKKAVTFDVTVTIDDDHLPVHGCIGIIDELPYSQSVVAVGYGHRNILTTRDCYQSLDGDRRYAGTGVAGWLELGEGWQPYLATTKDAVHDQRAWDRLMGYVFDKIEPLLKETENDQFRVILDDIALNLQMALNANLNVDIQYGGTIPPGGREHDGEEKAQEAAAGEAQRPLTPSDKVGEDTKRDAPAVAQLELQQLTDAEMQGALCEVWVDNSATVMGFINRDHGCIQEAMKAKPVNRMALHYMVARELASAIKGNPAAMKKLFKPIHLRQINEREEDVQERFIARMLMDRVRTPQYEEAA